MFAGILVGVLTYLGVRILLRGVWRAVKDFEENRPLCTRCSEPLMHVEQEPYESVSGNLNGMCHYCATVVRNMKLGKDQPKARKKRWGEL